ncbi:methionyl-tRNA formyltransferase [Lentilactobacillus curieae]|uniref:Methionyl-tRNA formyltransferase n=1 Tax=Lentilactobacillus curieae TaxID=1138822 RepID=A0A1S6QK62_9LACO|nr:methionyl-tRNA formyltransferase [Lentilactobacillus curieae]AQW22012.1 methionyl-tRNA formyltransferase [Lentilactobacillus curieae]
MTSIVFMGTPHFSVPILKGLVTNGYDVKYAVTQPDRPVGRKHVLKKTPVREAAEELSIPVLAPAKLSGSDEMSTIIETNPDLIITAAYGQFLPTKLLAAAKVAAVNVHGSLLPKYRGGAPVQYSIMNGDKQTGITILYMVKKMDAGDILSQKAIDIENDDDTETMFAKLSIVGRDLLLDTLPKVISGEIKPIPQVEEEVVFSPNIKPEEEVLDFSKSAFLVDAKVRALRPDPVAYTELNGKRTKIWRSKVVDATTELAPGTVVLKSKHELQLAAGDGTVISIIELQPAGKPKQKITDYLNGAGQSIKEGQKVID